MVSPVPVSAGVWEMCGVSLTGSCVAGREVWWPKGAVHTSGIACEPSLSHILTPPLPPSAEVRTQLLTGFGKCPRAIVTTPGDAKSPEEQG